MGHLLLLAWDIFHSQAATCCHTIELKRPTTSAEADRTRSSSNQHTSLPNHTLQDDSSLVLQLVLHHVMDLDTLCHVSAASSGCKSLIQAHIKEYLHDCVTEGLQCQEARWQSALRSQAGTAGEEQSDEPQQPQELVVSRLY